MIQKLELEVKETIEKLIKTATNFDVETLNSIYHNNLQVIMINNLGEKMISSKQMFIDLFKTKRDNKDVPLNTWSEFHHIEAKGHSAT